MTRKKGKRGKRERSPGAGDWPTASTGQAEEREESVSDEMATSAETFMSQPLPAIRPIQEAELKSPIGSHPDYEAAGMMQEEPGQMEAGRQEEPVPKKLSQPPPARGFFARLSRWFAGPSAQEEIFPKAAAPPPKPAASVVPPPPVGKASWESPAAAAPQPEPLPPPKDEKWIPPRPRPESPAASRVDHVLAVLTLERVLPELDAARRELEEMKLTYGVRIRQLEAERDQRQAEAEKSRAEKSEADSRAGTLREALDDVERRAHEAQGNLEERIRRLETERDQYRSEAESSRSEQHDLRMRIRQLEASLDIQQGGRSAEEWAALESRLRTLEEELVVAQHGARQQREVVEVELEATRERAQQEKATLEGRLRQIETERAQLAAKLATKEDELRAFSPQAESALARVKELEAEMAEWKARADAAAPPVESPPPPPKEAAPGPAAADAERLLDLHQQTVSRLTVILASADLLAMNPRVDSSVRETAREIRNQGQLLSEIIKSYTLPPDTRKAE